MHWPPAVFTILKIDSLAGLHLVFTFNFISKQVKTESGKITRGEKSPRSEISENNFRFDGSTVLLKRHVNFKCQYRFLNSVVGFLIKY